MTDTELIEWFAMHPVAARGIFEEYNSYMLCTRAINYTPQQRIDHLRDLIRNCVSDYMINRDYVYGY